MSKPPFVSALVSRLSPRAWWISAIALLLISQLAGYWLGEMYAYSQFPVSFFEGQTTFDAAKVRSYYAVLIERGTLSRYLWVQIADYGYMLTVFSAFFALTAAVYRSLSPRSWLKGVAFAMIFIAPMAAAFDALENLVSFFMLADPLNFADWLVYPYSAFACAKFAVYGLTYVWTLFAIVVSVLSYLLSNISNRKSRMKTGMGRAENA